MTEEDIITEMERQSEAQTARLCAMLLEAERPDLVAELNENLRRARLGIDRAQMLWHSISPAQRRVLLALGEGRSLIRCKASPTAYNAIGRPDAIARICRVATARNLARRDLLAWDGGAFDPEAKAVLTERGRFVLAHRDG